GDGGRAPRGAGYDDAPAKASAAAGGGTGAEVAYAGVSMRLGSLYSSPSRRRASRALLRRTVRTSTHHIHRLHRGLISPAGGLRSCELESVASPFQPQLRRHQRKCLLPLT